MKKIDNSYDFAKYISKNINKLELINLLENILKCKVADIELEGIEHYESIIEYNFSLIKANIKFQNKKNEEIYLKMIKGGKIKESIFCYWSLLYEEFSKNIQKNDDKQIQKAIITQVMSERDTTSLLLTLNSKLNYYAEISLIEFKSFLINNKIYERWCQNLEIFDEDILFIGRKMY